MIIAAYNARDVTRADFGCNGLNDLQTLANAVSVLPPSGGDIILSEGQFNFSGTLKINTSMFNPASSVSIEGRGPATTLFLNNGVSTTGNPQDVIDLIGTGTVNVKIKKMTINGNLANNPKSGGIWANTPHQTTDTQHVFEDIEFINCDLFSIGNSNNTRQAYFNRLRASNGGPSGYAFQFYGTDNHIDHCIAGLCAGGGFYVNGGDNHFTDIKAFWCGQGTSAAGIKADNNFNSSYFTACEAEENFYEGINVSGFGNSFVHCISRSNGQTGNKKGFDISGNGNLFASCVVGNWSGSAGTEDTGFYLHGSANGNMVVNRLVSNGGTGTLATQYSDVSTGVNFPSVLATGVGHTVDDVITALQNFGIVRQS